MASSSSSSSSAAAAAASTHTEDDTNGFERAFPYILPAKGSLRYEWGNNEGGILAPGPGHDMTTLRISGLLKHGVETGILKSYPQAQLNKTYLVRAGKTQHGKAVVIVDIDYNALTDDRTHLADDVRRFLVPYMDADTANDVHILLQREYGGYNHLMDASAYLTKELHSPAHSFSMKVVPVGGVYIHEHWGSFDMFKPTSVITRKQILDPSESSYLHRPLLREVLGLVFYIAPELANKLFVTHGPAQQERLQMWNVREYKKYQKTLTGAVSDAEFAQLEQRRRNLATHLATLDVKIDMENDPVCPWKSMYFFHGNNYKYLQSQTPEEIAANAQSSKNYNVCQLTWEGTYEKKNKRGGSKLVSPSAFTTPYYSKAIGYGTHVYTYRLTIDGKHLKMLDLRNDRVKESHGKGKLDPFRQIFELAGIEYGGSNRTPKARLLYELFKDSGIAGAVLNTDVEWIWFDPSSYLEWIPPTAVPGSVYYIGRELYTLPTILFNDKATDQDNHIDDVTNWVNMQVGVDYAVNDIFDKDTLLDHMQKARAFLATCIKHDVHVSDIPFLRWTLDATEEGYMPQFVPTTEEHARKAPAQWTAYQMDPTDKWHHSHPAKVTVYEVDYTAFWRAIAPELEGLWLADPLTEGNDERHDTLIYRILIETFRRYKVIGEHEYLLVTLPNGYTELVPRLPLGNQIDERLVLEDKNYLYDGTIEKDIITGRRMRKRLPFRAPYRRVMQITTPKRRQDEDDSTNPAFSASAAAAAAAEGSQSKKSHTSGRRLCIM